MATSTQQDSSIRPTGVADEGSDLIASRLRQTRAYVKLIDLCTGIVTLLVGILAYLLVIAVIDHWLIDLSRTWRFVALFVLLLGVALFFVWRLLPPILYPVNPVYAAQTIEHGAPSLKNSLINLVMLSGRRTSVSEVIYDGLHNEAAARLTHVPPETMVDRGPLIRVGYWLVALLAVAALYKVLSPKDPLESVARVATPWKEIERPSRVRVTDVQPGDTEIYRGQSIDVTARIEGLKDDEVASLLYSTQDRRYIDQPIVLEAIGASRFRATLSMGENGIQHSLVYRIQAGDHHTDDFQVIVRDAPHVEVKQVDYHFPPYTGLPDQSIRGQGDITALEGTLVTVRAEANEPISTAFVDLFANTPDSVAPDDRPLQSIPMRIDRVKAAGQFAVRLISDRKTTEAATYQIRFTTPDGRRNQQPARYRIDVTPDLEPDIEILQPRQRDIEVAENGGVGIEVRAYDPDFAIRQVRLVGAVRGVNRLDEALLDDVQAGQVIRKFVFRPRDYDLAMGDVIVFWAVAEDNRQSASRTPAPNRQRTENYRIRVIAPDPFSDDRDPEADPRGGERSRQQEDPEGGGSEESGSEEGGSEEGGSEEGGSEEGGSEEVGSEEVGSEEVGSEEGGSEEGGSEEGGSEEGGSEEGGSEEGGSDEGGSEEGGSEEGGSEQSRTEQSSAEQSGTPQGGSEEGGSGREDRGVGASDTDVAERSPEGQTDRREASSEEDGENDESEPVAPDGSNDGEAFERALRHLKEQEDQRQADTESSQSDPQEGKRDESSGSNETQEADQDAPPPRAEGSEKGGDDRGRRDDSATGQPSRDSVEPNRSPDGSNPSDSSTGNRGDTNESPDEGTSEGNDGSEGSATGDRPTTGRESNREPKESPLADENGEPSRSPSGADHTGREGTTDSNSEPSEGSQPTRAEPDPTDRRPSSNERAPVERDAEPGGGDAGPTDSPQPTAPEDSGAPADAAAPGDRDLASEESTNPEGAIGESAGDPGERSPSGGSPGESRTSGAVEPAAERADKANLDYARRATDMVLEQLKDQEQNAELRERLGWSEEEMRAFVRRWEQMRRQARQLGPTGQQARRRLDDRLRGLGLTPADARVRSTPMTKDGPSQLRQGGSEVPIPAEYREQYGAFLKSSRPAPRKVNP